MQSQEKAKRPKDIEQAKQEIEMGISGLADE